MSLFGRKKEHPWPAEAELTMADQLDWNCKDCRGDTRNEYYMVRDEVWHKARGGTGLLCIGCLEKRLARRLSHTDFRDVSINAPGYLHLNKHPKSRRLLDRIAAH